MNPLQSVDATWDPRSPEVYSDDLYFEPVFLNCNIYQRLELGGKYTVEKTVTE